MKHQQQTPNRQAQMQDPETLQEMTAAMPDFQHAFLWHNSLCDLSEKVLKEYAEAKARASLKGPAPHKSTR